MLRSPLYFCSRTIKDLGVAIGRMQKLEPGSPHPNLLCLFLSLFSSTGSIFFYYSAPSKLAIPLNGLLRYACCSSHSASHSCSHSNLPLLFSPTTLLISERGLTPILSCYRPVLPFPPPFCLSFSVNSLPFFRFLSQQTHKAGRGTVDGRCSERDRRVCKEGTLSASVY